MKRFFTQPMTRNAWAVLALFFLALSISSWATKQLIDFHVFFTAGARAWGGEALYRAADGDMPFKYAPIIALLISPLSLFPERIAVLIWLIATAGFLLRFLQYGRDRYFPNAPTWSVLLVVFFILHFHRHLLELGQCDLLIAALAAESEIQRERRPLLSGLLLALVCLFKPPFLLFVALAAFFREWRRLSAFAIGVIAGLALPALRFGLSGNFEQLSSWQNLLASTTSPMFCALDNQSIFGLVCRYLAPAESPAFKPLSLFAAAALFAITVGPTLRTKEPNRRRLLLTAVAFYLSASLSPLGWRTNLVGLVPLFFLALEALQSEPLRTKLALLAAPTVNAIIGLFVFDLIGKKNFAALMSFHVFGIFAIATAVPLVLFVTAREARSTSDSASLGGSSAPGDPSPRPAPR